MFSYPDIGDTIRELYSDYTPEALEDKEIEEGAAFFKRGGRRTTYRPAPKAVYRPRPRPVSKPTPRTKAISKPKVSPKLANKPTTKPTTRQIVKPNIIPVTPKPIPPKPAPKPNPPIQAPKTSSALEAAENKTNYKKNTYTFDEKKAQAEGWRKDKQTNTVHPAATKAGAAWVAGEATLAVVDYLTAGTYSAATKGMGLIIGATSSESMYKDTYYTVTTYKRQGANSTQVVIVVEEYADASKTKLVQRSVTNPVDIPNGKTNN